MYIYNNRIYSNFYYTTNEERWDMGWLSENPQKNIHKSKHSKI